MHVLIGSVRNHLEEYPPFSSRETHRTQPKSVNEIPSIIQEKKNTESDVTYLYT